MSDNIGARVLRQVFNRAWHNWRDDVLADSCDYSIPFNARDLCDELVLEMERAMAAQSPNPSISSQGS